MEEQNGLASTCSICEKVPPKEQLVYHLDRGFAHILCLTKEISNQDDVITAFTDQEFYESSDSPPEAKQVTSTEGLHEYNDTLKVDEGEYSNDTSGYANDTKEDKEEKKEAKQDALKKPYGKLGMYKDALNYDFDDDDDTPQDHQYDNDAIEYGETPKSKSSTTHSYQNDLKSDDEEGTKTPVKTATPIKLSGYQNDKDHENDSESDDKEVTLDQGSYMQQPMDDMLGLGSSPDVLRQRSVPRIKLGYVETKDIHDYNKTSDESEGGKIGKYVRSPIETYVEKFSDSSDDEEEGSFESLRNSAEAMQPGRSNLDPNFRDWNTEYQEILSLPEDTERGRLEKQMRLINIISEFKQAVERIGKIIIAESNKIPEDKTYKPLAAKGIAGGQKYIVENLFFKLSIDNKGLYGADEFSRKVANIELLGLKGYIKCQPQIPNLRTPLLARVDFMGYRLLAMCVLPIGSNTLVYGSDDGGRTVNTVDPVVNKMMEKAGRLLNLQPHKVSPEKKTVWAAADVEVHRGNDGRYYVLDTARVFPPECPYREVTAIRLDPLEVTQYQRIATKLDVEQADLKEILGTNMTSESLSEGTLFYDESDDSVVNLLASGLAGKRIFGKAYLIYGLDARFLFYQLRPELVMQYKKALNPDAFTNFTRFDDHYKAHNVAVLEATNYLRQVVISRLAHDLMNDSPYVESSKMLKEVMHKYGVNVRYLGLLRSLTSSIRLQTLMLFEMICRCVKNFLARKLRKFSDRHESAITKYFNILLGNSKASEFYWTHIIKVQIEAKFGQYGPSLMGDELSTDSNLRRDISKYLLFHSICSAMGIKYKLGILKSMQNNSHFFDPDFPFTEDMIESIEPRATIATTVEVENPELRQSLDKARHLVSEAMLSFNGKQYDEAHDMLQEAKQVLSVYQTVPAELAAKLFYIQGNIHLARHNFDAAESAFRASLFAASKISGTECFRDIRIKERNKELSFPLFALLIINNLAAASEITLRYYNYRHWSHIFHSLWIASKCPLTKSARRMLFGVEVPKPLLNAVAFGKNYDVDFEANYIPIATHYSMPPEAEHQFDYFHPISQTWINNLTKFEESSGVNLYIDWTNEEEMKMIGVTYLIGRIDIPCVVDTTQPIKVTYNLPDDMSLQNTKIAATIRSENYWNYYQQDFLWEPPLESHRGQLEIPPEVWDRVPANDRFLVVGLYDILSGWCINTTSVVPVNHTHTLTLGFQEWRTPICEGMMNGAVNVIPIFAQVSEMRAKKIIERNNTLIHGISETGKAYAWLNQRIDYYGAKKPYTEGDIIEGLIGKEIVDIDVNRDWITKPLVTDDSVMPPQVSYNVALTKKGLLFTWGTGADGVLGLGFSSFLETNPRVVRSLQNTIITKVTCGRQFIVAISKTGHVFIWGKIGGRNVGNYPQLISISPEMANFAFKENELLDNPVVDVACGPEHVIMLSNRGSFYYFGNTYPDGGFVVNKKIILPGIRIIQIASGAKHILLLGDNNKLYSFGSNAEGELGTMSDELPFPDLEEPFNQIREVKFNSAIFQLEPQFLKIGAEYNYSVALSKDHELFVWGNGFFYPFSLKPSLQRYNLQLQNFVPAGNMSILLPDIPYEENRMLEALRDEQLEGYVPTPRRINNAPNVQNQVANSNNNNNNTVPLEDYLALKLRLEKLEELVAQLIKK